MAFNQLWLCSFVLRLKTAGWSCCICCYNFNSFLLCHTHLIYLFLHLVIFFCSCWVFELICWFTCFCRLKASCLFRCSCSGAWGFSFSILLVAGRWGFWWVRAPLICLLFACRMGRRRFHARHWRYPAQRYRCAMSPTIDGINSDVSSSVSQEPFACQNKVYPLR